MYKDHKVFNNMMKRRVCLVKLEIKWKNKELYPWADSCEDYEPMTNLEYLEEKAR